MALKNKNKRTPLTYTEAAKMINVGPETISGYAKLHDIPKGTMMIGGRKRGVVSREAFEQFVKDKNYLRDNDNVVWSDDQ